jgi:hypothetical protein
MVIGIDDLLIAAAITAIVGAATSSVAAGQQESLAKDAAARQKKNQLDDEKVDFYIQRAKRYGNDTTGLEMQARRGQIERGYDQQVQQAERIGSLQRDDGIGNAAASFLSNAVKAGYSNASSGADLQKQLQDQAANYSNRAQSYDLNRSDYGLSPGPQTQAFTPQAYTPSSGAQLNPNAFGLDSSQYDPNDDQYGSVFSPGRFRL